MKSDRQICPFCYSQDTVKTGVRRNKYLGDDIRWHCNECRSNWGEYSLLRKLARVSGEPIAKGKLVDSKILNNYARLASVIQSFRPNGHAVNSQKEHKKLVRQAIEFLNRLGCVSISTEHRLNGSKNRIDVVGIRGNDLIAIECGSNSNEKLIWLEAMLNNHNLSELYIQPYSQSEPYKWNPSLNVCRTCGNIISKTS